MANKRAVPVVLSVAGSDNSGGAGIQADIKTFTSLGVYGTTALTCVVAEHPGKVQSIHALPPSMVREQMELVFEAFPVAAMKTGMLYSEAIIREVADFLESLPRNQRPKVVVDPVMVATSGAVLFKPAAVKVLKERLFPLAALVTPNLDEAEVLLGRRLRSLEDIMEAARDAGLAHGVPFLVKGGHLKLEESTDVLFADGEMDIFSESTVPGVKTHGTGCTYSAAIAASLARGGSLTRAVGEGKAFITRAIRDHFHIGRYQPLNHLSGKRKG